MIPTRIFDAGQIVVPKELPEILKDFSKAVCILITSFSLYVSFLKYNADTPIEATSDSRKAILKWSASYFQKQLDETS